MFALIATAALLVAGDPAAVSNDDTRQAYQAAKEHAGRTPDDQVKLAYWCEAHGLAAERMRHLAQAVLANPNHAAARGLLGLVARQDRWMRPAAVADQVEADADLKAKLAEYDARRSATPYTADGQWNLAQWADERGLKEQAKAHYTAVVRLDPKRDQAWKRLGYTKHDGHWLTDADLATAKADAEAQEMADKKWKPLLGKWKTQLSKPSHRVEAEANLLTVTDPRATASIARVFLTNRVADQLVAARLLGQIDSSRASRLLAGLTIVTDSAEVRRIAVETLRNRDSREFADLLITRLRKPIRYQVQPVGGPGSPGALFIEGSDYNKQRIYAPPSATALANSIPMANMANSFVTKNFTTGRVTGANLLQQMRNGQLDDFIPSPQPDMQLFDEIKRAGPGTNSEAMAELIRKNTQDVNTEFKSQLRGSIDQTAAKEHKDPSEFGFGLTKQVMAQVIIPVDQIVLEAQKTALVAQQQLRNDVQMLDMQNQEIRRDNDKVQQILSGATGENHGDDAQAWKSWWINQLGYASRSSTEAPVPTFVENVPIAYQPAPITPQYYNYQVTSGFTRMSCFGAGTLVQTQTGPQPIEHLKVGDMVLTQSTATGALGYHPVLITHHNPPSATFRIKLADDTIVASHFHRFWVARRGWVMARDLKAGDPVRTLGGVVPVDSVEAGKVELVYNLDIADDADFFAGTSAALVHDNTLPDPRLIPFDLAPEVVAQR